MPKGAVSAEERDEFALWIETWSGLGLYQSRVRVDGGDGGGASAWPSTRTRREGGAPMNKSWRGRRAAIRADGPCARVRADVDLFVLVSYGHYDYAQVNNFQRTQLARYVAHECIQDWHACAAA